MSLTIILVRHPEHEAIVEQRIWFMALHICTSMSFVADLVHCIAHVHERMIAVLNLWTYTKRSNTPDTNI